MPTVTGFRVLRVLPGDEYTEDWLDDASVTVTRPLHDHQFSAEAGAFDKCVVKIEEGRYQGFRIDARKAAVLDFTMDRGSSPVVDVEALDGAVVLTGTCNAVLVKGRDLAVLVAGKISVLGAIQVRDADVSVRGAVALCVVQRRGGAADVKITGRAVVQKMA